VSMLRKEKQRSGTLVDGGTAKSAQAASPSPSTPADDSVPIGNRKWTVGEPSSVASREERTKNVICKSRTQSVCDLYFYVYSSLFTIQVAKCTIHNVETL